MTPWVVSVYAPPQKSTVRILHNAQSQTPGSLYIITTVKKIKQHHFEKTYS